MQPCIASIDQGTSSSRVLIINADGVVLGSHQVEHSQFYPVAGQVEHDPLEIWNSVKVCLSGAIEGLSSQVQVVAIGITNQRETTVVWNKHTGQPYHNAIVWNDTRTEDICLELSQGDADKYREKTGLPIASYFSASKLIYLLRTVPGLRQDAENGDALFGTIDTWLIWKLTNGASHVTDVTNASRTLCMDLKTLTWDDDILGDFNIPRKMLPAIHPSSYPFGNVDTDHGHLAATPITQKQLTIAPTAADATANFHLYRNTPISGVLGDQNAALFGQACFEAGDSKCTYGTGAFMLFNTGTAIMPSKSGLLTTVGYQIGASADYKSAGGEVGPPSPAVYALEGSVAYSGSVIQWLRDNLGIVKNAEESEALARSVPDNGGVYFVPAFAGLFAPYWRGDARGVIVGLTAFNTKAHIVRAALEASAFQTVEVAQAMQKDSDHKMPLVKLRVDGGGTVNSLMMQFLSDLLNVPLVKPK
ncbi:glycerol kinase, partial [Ochromonadaceae sp. CCMP2298]